MIKIKKGLNLPITGEPKPLVESVQVKQVAILGRDYIGLKPTMLVREGDLVKKGQAVIADKANPGVCITAPASGKVAAINRGERRLFLSMVINVEGNNSETFTAYGADKLRYLDANTIEEQLIASGLWTAFRTRPFSKVPKPSTRPHSIFVNVMDTNPLAAPVATVLKGQEHSFNLGLTVLDQLMSQKGKVFVCKEHGLQLSGPDLKTVQFASFSGPHPAGLSGTHIHFLDPVGPNKTVWTINYQDLIAVGKFFAEGKLDTERTISFAGPMVKEPKLLKVNLGASIDELSRHRLKDGEIRLVSGSVYSGHKAGGAESFLGRYHQQVVALGEGREREFMGWHMPGLNKFSIKKTFASSWLTPKKKFAMTTSTGGSVRAIVPVGSYEKVMPLDIEPAYLLRSLLSGDTDTAQQLGALELDEEDMGLLSFVSATKLEYGKFLRDNLTKIERDG